MSGHEDGTLAFASTDLSILLLSEKRSTDFFSRHVHSSNHCAVNSNRDFGIKLAYKCGNGYLLMEKAPIWYVYLGLDGSWPAGLDAEDSRPISPHILISERGTARPCMVAALQTGEELAIF
jgi:hypothetical protein